MNPEIINYIQQQLDRGVNPQVLRDYMLRYYPAEFVDEHLNFVINMHNKTFAEKQIAKPQQTPQQVTQQAIQQPSAKPVQEVKHVIHVSKTTWFFVFIFFVGAGLIILGINSLSTTKIPKQLDINVEPSAKAVYPGDTLKFQVSFFNMGKSAGFDVNVKYEILKYGESEVITEKRESLSLQTRADLIREINLPHDIGAGRYMLRATVSYGKYYADSSFVFDVLNKTGATQVIENETEARNITENITQNLTKPEEGIPKENRTSTVEGEGLKKSDNPFYGLAEWELDSAIKGYKDIEQAANYCNQLESTRDYCFYKLGYYANNSILCDNIVDISLKDRCLVSVMMLGNYDLGLCEKISDESFKDSCISLVESYKMKDNYENNNYK